MKKAKSVPVVRGPNGGVRPGAGRKRDRLPVYLIERIGSPPQSDDPIAISKWSQRLLIEVAWALAKGEIGRELASDLRKFSADAGRSQPQHLIWEARRILQDDERESKQDGEVVATESLVAPAASKRR